MFTFALCLLALGWTADPDPLLDRIRQKMSDNLSSLPNYTCTELIERTTRPAPRRKALVLDRVRLEVAYVAGRELLAWPGPEEFEGRPIQEFVVNKGAIGSGNFALHAHNVFKSRGPRFSPLSDQVLRRRNSIRRRLRSPAREELVLRRNRTQHGGGRLSRL